IRDNKVTDAVKALDKLSKGRDADYAAKSNVVLGDYYLSQNDLVKGESYYKKVLGDKSKVNPDTISAALKIGNLYLYQGKNDQAGEYFEWANTATGDKEVRILEVLGTYYFRIDKKDLAENKFLKGAQSAPNDIPIRLTLIEFYELKGEATNANKYFREIQKLNPEFKYSTLGTYFAQTGNNDLAVKYLTRSQQSEKDPYVDYVLGAIYYNQGMDAEKKGDAATAKSLKDKGVKSLENASKKGVKDATDALAEIKNSGK
ncbi:MAG: tetratricopeptide repeat protein, partial [Fusobacteriales bacterium]|nr:tetratricopeptide repeat protein [Fusobacteriales bacterium]